MFHDVGETQQHNSWRTYLLALYNSKPNAMWSLKLIEDFQRGLGGLGCAEPLQTLPKFLLLNRSTQNLHPTDPRLEA
jgi:hypothetical protein